MDRDVIIIGGGLVGASLALALHAARLRVALVEARPLPPPPEDGSWDQRIYAISPGSAAFLENLGVWRRLDAARVQRVEDMRVFGDDVVSELDFSAYETGLRELAFIVENRALQRAIWEALQSEPHIECIVPAGCDRLELTAEAAELSLTNGRRLRARLVVGADGADSWVRAQAQIDAVARPYRQSAVVANFSVAQPHHGAAFQWFRRDGVLALLPLPRARVSMVWSTTETHAAQLQALAPPALAAEVTAASHGALGALETITPAAGFALNLQRARRFVAPRVALVGDAAHSIHPLAGQGVNLGFRDARELAQVLAQRGPYDCGDFHLLRRYERARREDVLVTQFSADALQRLFNRDPRGRFAGVRNFGLRLTNRGARLKSLLVRHAVE
ncbi:MAG TPA: UbiH/UbiF family hydroxylase [Burkholderiales bacterium]|nr:UbiH/UbiF family hydroxylase [Burkholderiales bacterium]